jgi:ferritin-like metal-binding protein YciE
MPTRKTAARRKSTTKRAGATSATARRRTRAATTTMRAKSAATIRPNPTDQGENVYHVGLRNAHSMEQEALQLMRRQVERLEHYPDVAKRLRAHITETERQAQRLQKIMEQHETSPSTLKDLTLQMMGNMAALGNAIAGDEILKNAFANQAFEAFEIAAYKSLIALAEKQGDRRALPLLKASLREEEQMLAWSDKNIQKVTMDYVRREEMEKEASH